MMNWHTIAAQKREIPAAPAAHPGLVTMGNGKKPIFTSATDKHCSTAGKKGTGYYCKVRGFAAIDGQKYHTDHALKATRTVP